MRSGTELITQERERQKTEEKYTGEHDDAHTDEELARFAAFYAHPDNPNPSELYPKNWDKKWDKRKNHTRVRQLAIAGALCAAEIDRLQREELK